MLESASQKRLMDIATQASPLPLQDRNRLQAYQELVFHRLNEVISNCLPLSVEHLGEERLERLIIAFMHHKPKTPFIWQAPNEFRAFLKEEDLVSDLPFIHDLLWFEWIEVELFMGEYTPVQEAAFSWENNYHLASNAVIKDLEYKVFEGDVLTKGAYWALGYYDIENGDVLFRELNEVLYLFLEHQESEGTQKALEQIATLAEADSEDVKAAIEEALVTLVHSGVLEKG